VDFAQRRTILKSAPELWQQLLDGEALREAFGSAGSLRVEPLKLGRELAFETPLVKGRITLEQTGWGTKVEALLTARSEGGAPEPAPPAEREPRWRVGGALRGLLPPLPLGRGRLTGPWKNDPEPPPPPPPAEDALEEAVALLFKRLSASRRRPFQV